MLLGGKVDDPLRPIHVAAVGHEHPTDLDVAALAGDGIGLEVLRERLLEHERDALAHHANGVDGVDQGVGVCLEQIAGGVANHQKYQPGRTTVLRVTPASSAA